MAKKEPKPKKFTGYTTYLTRKMPIRLHRELQRLSAATHMSLQDALSSCLEVGVKYYCHHHGWRQLPPNTGEPLDWTAVDESEGLSNMQSRGEK